MRRKLEEVYPPPLSEFAYITDHTYTTEEVIVNSLTRFCDFVNL